MADAIGPGPGLAPPGDAAVNKARIDPVALLGSDAQPLGNPGTKALDEDVGFGDEIEDEIASGILLQVGELDSSPSKGRVDAPGRREAQTSPGRALNTDHLGSEIGEHHGRVRPRPERCEFDHSNPVQRPAHQASLWRLGRS